jgi:hypothetical protein
VKFEGGIFFMFAQAFNSVVSCVPPTLTNPCINKVYVLTMLLAKHANMQPMMQCMCWLLGGEFESHIICPIEINYMDQKVGDMEV